MVYMVAFVWYVWWPLYGIYGGLCMVYMVAFVWYVWWPLYGIYTRVPSLTFKEFLIGGRGDTGQVGEMVGGTGAGRGIREGEEAGGGAVSSSDVAGEKVNIHTIYLDTHNVYI
jgi:hypothetical protein